jgi:hypothetical protein
MITIPGKIVPGMRAATRTVEAQMPHFLKVCPELESCRRATINVILDCQLDIIAPDFVIGPVVWSADLHRELFGLLKIRLEVDEPRAETDAWIYIPYGSPHRLNPYHAEILAPPLSIQGSTCKIHLKAAKVLVAS